MTTKPTIYLHIGAGKTGSTTIQVWLKQVENALATAGYLIFDTNFEPHAHRDQLSNQQQYFHSVLESGPTALAEFHEKFRKNLIYMQQNGYHSAVLSAENLINEWTGAYTWFDPLLDECNWKIIAYVRNQPQYIVSAWKEWGYWRHDFEELFTDHINADWLKAIEVWEQRFGRENIYLGILEKKCLVDGLLHHDFASAINTPHIVANDADLIYANPSMNNRTALFFSKIRQQYLLRNANMLELPNLPESASQQELLQEALKINSTLNSMFHFKPLIVSRAPVSGTQEIDAPLSLLNTSMLQTIHEHFAESNQKLVELYRPDLDANTAFPTITTSFDQSIPADELTYHGFHIAFESLRSLHEATISNEKTLRQTIKRIHTIQESQDQITQNIKVNQNHTERQIQQLVSQHKSQLEILETLNQHTTTLWNDIQAHNLSFSHTQLQISQIQQQINDLYQRQNFIKYWSLRIWRRIKTIFSRQ